MPTPVTPEYRFASRHKAEFAHYTALLLLCLHWAFVLYINSSYLEQLASHRIIDILYVVGAIVTIGSFFYASHILTRFGNIFLIKVLTFIEFCALVGMGLTVNPYIGLSLFVVHQAVVPILLFNLDIIMEVIIGDKEESTGRQRGILLTIMSLTTALAPLALGRLTSAAHHVSANASEFVLVYLLSAFFLVPFIFVVLKYFKTFKDPVYPHFRFREGLLEFWQYKDIRNVFFAHFLLQFFFTWMVIYTPLYLTNVIGLSWDEVGSILFVGLMAYVFLEYAIGKVADTYIGEKEMMAFGFAVIAMATASFVFLDNSSIPLWMTAMFLTRVGASFIEVTTESYFFKHTAGKDTNVISLFRITRPLSYVVGPVLGVLTLHFFSFSFLFVILGTLMIPGLFFAMALKDTK
ncbi:MFS transporter [Candidatus Kaiserbacteria bacterium]|nr:MAG: MFS transporter [Candidatus Kaiserbacteria bacterium]